MVDISITEQIESKFLPAQLNREDSAKALYKSYTKAQYPILYAIEVGEDPKTLISAVRELRKGIKAPDSYFLCQGLATMYPIPDAAPKEEIVALGDELTNEVQAFMYKSLEAGENFTSLLWTPQEVLDKVFEGRIPTSLFQRLYLRFLDAYGEHILAACRESCSTVSMDFLECVESAHKYNSYAEDTKERRVAVAKTVGRVGVRGGLVILMNTYGNIVLIVAAVMSVSSLLLGLFMIILHAYLTAALFILSLVCCGVFVWQARVTYGDNLKHLGLSFGCGLGAYSAATLSCVVKLLVCLVRVINGG